MVSSHLVPATNGRSRRTGCEQERVDAAQQKVSRLGLLAGVVAYITALHFAYVAFVSPRWLLSGLIYYPADDGSLIAAHLLAFVPAIGLAVRASRAADVVLWVLYTIAFVPTILIPQFVLGTGWALMPFNLVLTASFGLMLCQSRLPVAAISSPIRSKQLHVVLSVSVAALLLAVILVTFGVRLELPDLADVYDVRDYYSETVSAAGRLAAYAVGWSGSAANPMLVALGMALGARWLMAAGILGELAIFSVTGFKSLLFSGPLVVPLAFALRARQRHFGLWVIWGLTALIVAACLAQATTGWTLLADLFVRRLLVVPGQLAGYYVEFFSVNPTYGLSHSVLGWLNDDPYPQNQARLIAYVYFGHPAASSNGNLWADGFANFGLPGVAAVSVLALFMLWAMNAISVGRPLWVSGSVLATASIGLTNSALLTSLLSHGIGAAMLLVVLIPRTDPGTNSNRGTVSRRVADNRGVSSHPP